MNGSAIRRDRRAAQAEAEMQQKQSDDAPFATSTHRRCAASHGSGRALVLQELAKATESGQILACHGRDRAPRAPIRREMRWPRRGGENKEVREVKDTSRDLDPFESESTLVAPARASIREAAPAPRRGPHTMSLTNQAGTPQV